MIKPATVILLSISSIVLCVALCMVIIQFCYAADNQTIGETDLPFYGKQFGYINAIDIETGKEIWKVERKIIPSAILVNKGTTYFIDQLENYLYALDAKTGQEKWKYHRNNTIIRVPTISNDIMYFVAGDHLYALDLNTAKEIWRFKIDIGTNLQKPAVINEGLLYFQTGYDNIVVIDPITGETKSRFKMNSRVQSFVVEKNVVYFSDGKCTHSFDMKTGEEKWRRRNDCWYFASELPLILDGAMYFIGCGKFQTWDIQAGQERWEFSLSGGLSISFLISGGVVYLGGNHIYPYLYALDIKTGKEIWKADVQMTTIYTPILVDKNVLYFGGSSADGTSFCAFEINNNTFKQKWMLKVEGDISDPVIADSILYFGSGIGFYE